MAQTKEGAAKAVARIKEKYGDDFFAKAGALGGRAKVPKGFAVNKALAIEAGRKGGTISKRRPTTVQKEAV